jgi:hypothetical protein
MKVVRLADYACTLCISICKKSFFFVFKPSRNVSTNISTNRIHESHSGGNALSNEDILLFQFRSLAVNAPQTLKGTETPRYHTVSFKSWTNVHTTTDRTPSREPITCFIILSPIAIWGCKLLPPGPSARAVLKRKSAAARLLRLRVRIPPGAWMLVSCKCLLYR